MAQATDQAPLATADLGRPSGERSCPICGSRIHRYEQRARLGADAVHGECADYLLRGSGTHAWSDPEDVFAWTV